LKDIIEKESKLDYYNYFYLCYFYILIFLKIFDIKINDFIKVIYLIQKSYYEHQKLWTVSKIINCLYEIDEMKKNKEEQIFSGEFYNKINKKKTKK